RIRGLCLSPLVRKKGALHRVPRAMVRRTEVDEAGPQLHCAARGAGSLSVPPIPMSQAPRHIDPTLVSLAHNAMADEYDQLDDLWYPFLFAQIHELIAANLDPGVGATPQALDV